MSSTNEEFGRGPRDPRPTEDSIVTITLEDGVMIYDRDQPGAWISSTTACDVAAHH